MAQLIYICSAAHSGSTLLDLLLGSHPEIFSLGEITEKFAGYMKNSELCTCRSPLHECSIWNGVRDKLLQDLSIDIFRSPEQLPISEDVIWNEGAVYLQKLVYYQKLFLAYLGRSYLAPFEVKFLRHVPGSLQLTKNAMTLYQTVSKVTGREILVDSSKSPLRMKWLFMLNPEKVKIIYLIRDGRGVMASHMRKGRSPDFAVRSWVHSNNRAQQLLRNVPKEVYRLFRYEDLCETPAKELERLCQFIGVTFDEQMLRFRQVEHHNVGGNRMRFGTEGIITNIESWRNRLTEDNIRTFEAIGGPLNRQFGYVG